jgi:hypothetical protein
VTLSVVNLVLKDYQYESESIHFTVKTRIITATCTISTLIVVTYCTIINDNYGDGKRKDGKHTALCFSSSSSAVKNGTLWYTRLISRISPSSLFNAPLVGWGGDDDDEEAAVAVETDDNAEKALPVLAPLLLLRFDEGADVLRRCDCNMGF